MLARFDETISTSRLSGSLRALLDRLLDYAGLFPPASLSMADAVRNYDLYRRGEHAWALGRFIVPAARLDEFDEINDAQSAEDLQTGFLQLSVLVSDIDQDLHAIEGRHEIEAVEVKAETRADVERIAAAVGKTWEAYVEITDFKLLDAIAKRGLRAKIRAGGVTTDAFPEPERIAEFIAACVKRGVAFKATAGLHHPLRCQRALTYETDSPIGPMHGFVNLLIAAALPEHALDILRDDDPASFDLGHGSLRWRGVKVTTQQLLEMRRQVVLSIGSCSFEEPLADLRELGWL